MEVGNRFEDLLDDATRVAFRVDRFLDNAIQQLSSKRTTNEGSSKRPPLDDHDDLLIALEDVAILDDVLVTDRSEKIRVQEKDPRWVTKLFRDDFGTKILSGVAIVNGDDLRVGSPEL